MECYLTTSSRSSFALVNTYTNAAGETVTERMTPEYPRPTDSDDSKPWPKADKLLKGRASSSEETSEPKGEWLSENPTSSGRVTPEVECELVMDSLVLGGDVPSWHEDEQPLDSPVFSREVSPAAEWRRLAWPSSRGVTPEPLLLLTYYTPQAADPDFDYIPLH